MQRAAFVMVLADWDRGRGNTGTEKLRCRWKAYTKSQQNCSFIFWQDPDQIRILFLILQGSEQTSHQAGELQRFQHWQVGLVNLFKAKNSSTESTLYLFFSRVGAVICTQRGDLHGRAIQGCNKVMVWEHQALQRRFASVPSKPGPTTGVPASREPKFGSLIHWNNAYFNQLKLIFLDWD